MGEIAERLNGDRCGGVRADACLVPCLTRLGLIHIVGGRDFHVA